MLLRRLIAGLALAVAALTVSAAPAHAQGKGSKHYAATTDRAVSVSRTVSAAPAHEQGKGPKHYAVTTDRAVSVTRTVLVRQGYDVVRIERVGATQVVYYRAGNHGRGRGKGRLEKMVIRTVDRRIVFEDAPPAIMVDIDVNLKL